MRRRLILVALIVVFSALSSAITRAASSPAAATLRGAFGGLHWRCIGPFRGGRSVAVSGVPGDPLRFYFGAAGGGVWRTDNAGQTWSPIFDSGPVASIGAIAVAPSDPNVIYVGSGEADFRSDLQQGNGMYRSADAGRTWTPSGLSDTRAIGRISVDPHDSADLVVAALGHPYGPNAQRGVFRSTDGGSTWRRTLFIDENTGAIAVTRDYQHPHILFAALLQTRRPPWNVYAPSKGPGSGLYRSADGGTTWTAVTGGGFPVTGLGRIGVAIAPSNANRVYAIIDAKAGGLYRSDDAGTTWKLLSGDRRIWGRGWYFGEVSVDPLDADRVYVSNTSLYVSADGGATFDALKGAPGGDDYHMLWIDPSAGSRMVLASDQGVVVSVDGAKTWSSWYNQPTAQLYHVATDTRFPFWVYGAQQDSGAIGVPSRSLHRGITQADWTPLEVGGESDSIAPDPAHPGVLFGSRVVREDLATRVTRSLPPTLAHPGDWRSTWTLPLVFSPLDAGVLYASRQAVFRTADGGGRWETISPDLTRPEPGVPPNLDPPAAADIDTGASSRHGVVYTLAPSPIRKGVLWAGTDDGNIALTRDEGTHWTSVTPPELSAWSKIGGIEASHFDPQTAYAAVDRHRLDDLQPYVYRTRDGGRTWQNAVAGIADGSFVNAVREDPLRRGLLYAATETGVYVSFDDGDRWQSLALNMPHASIRDVAVRDDALVIATHGRSFWILDDVTPLRQSDAAVARAPAWLFVPQIAFRVRPGNDDGTSLPPEVPAGENPPDGAIVNYTLRTAAKRVELDIFDRNGAHVRHWSSTEPAAPADARKLVFPAFWVPPQPPPATTPGLHRFVWDLHYASALPPADDAASDPFTAPGIWAPPGIYDLRLTVDGRRFDRNLQLRIDPRESATQSALDAQFRLARRIEALRAGIRASIGSARKNPELQEQLARTATALSDLQDAEQSAPEAPTPDERTAFEREANAVRDALAAPRPKGSR